MRSGLIRTPRPFFEADEFGWLEPMHAAYDDIVAEFGAVLEQAGDALVPYVPETGQPSQEGWDAVTGSVTLSWGIVLPKF